MSRASMENLDKSVCGFPLFFLNFYLHFILDCFLNFLVALLSNGKLVHLLLFEPYLFKLLGDCSYNHGAVLLALY